MFYVHMSDHKKQILHRQCRSFENDLFKENGPEKPFYENSLCTDVHTLISWEALLRPTSDGLELTRQLEVLQKLRGYSPTQLYCEILRACCLGLAETADSPGELRWAVFTFLKAPSLLLRLHRSIFGTISNVLKFQTVLLNSRLSRIGSKFSYWGTKSGSRGCV